MATTWGSATEELARIGRVVTYDRRGYARSGGHPARSVATHSADAAALLPRASAQDAPRRIIAFSDTPSEVVNRRS
jgi:pimeloyl-ACP methyl ester carboxylesterase